MKLRTGFLLAVASVAMVSNGAFADEERTADYTSTVKSIASPSSGFPAAPQPPAPDETRAAVNDYTDEFIYIPDIEPAAGDSHAPVEDVQKDITVHSGESEAAKDSEVAHDSVHDVAKETVKQAHDAVAPKSAAPVAPVVPEESKVVSAQPVAAQKSATMKKKAPVHGNGSGHAHWGYVGGESAAHWGSLDASYHACAAGKRQSPINIDQYAQGELPAIEVLYQPTPLNVVNNGHTLQVDYAQGSGVSVGGKSYNLLQLHFHTPSEHYLDGSPYPMEVHFVHKAADGALGVVGVMMKIGAHNPVIEGIWQNAPMKQGKKEVAGVQIDGSQLLPASREYYKYEGSLTTPPCSEGVQWHVLKTPIEISQKQLKAFQALFPVNARPVQPLEGRTVMGN